MDKRVLIEENNPQAPDSPEAHLEQIRAILFGQQMLAIEQKLRGLEQHLQAQTAALKQELLDRIAALENRLAGLQQETEERQNADHALQSSLDTATTWRISWPRQGKRCGPS